MSTLRVLVTGGTGYLGSHIVAQLLQRLRYLVRTTVKPGDKSLLQEIFPNAGDRLEAVETKSLSCDYVKLGLMKDVDAVIHAALPGGAKFVEGVVNGTTKILEAAIQAGIKKVVITSTFVTLCEVDTYREAFSSNILGPESWCTSPSVKFDSVADINKAARSGKVSGFAVYQMSKTLAERRVWEIAQRAESEGKSIDVTTILPPIMFGPYATPTYPLPSSSEDLNANQLIYQLLSHSSSSPYPDLTLGYMVDVRDVARAHILALSELSDPSQPSDADKFNKRIILSSHTFSWPQLAEMIAEKKPDLKERLPSPSSSDAACRQASAPLDLSLMKRLFQMKSTADHVVVQNDGQSSETEGSNLPMIPWEETVLAALELVLKWEEAYGNVSDEELGTQNGPEGSRQVEDGDAEEPTVHRGKRTATRDQPEERGDKKLRRR